MNRSVIDYLFIFRLPGLTSNYHFLSDCGRVLPAYQLNFDHLSGIRSIYILQAPRCIKILSVARSVNSVIHVTATNWPLTAPNLSGAEVIRLSKALQAATTPAAAPPDVHGAIVLVIVVANAIAADDALSGRKRTGSLIGYSPPPGRVALCKQHQMPLTSKGARLIASTRPPPPPTPHLSPYCTPSRTSLRSGRIF